MRRVKRKAGHRILILWRTPMCWHPLAIKLNQRNKMSDTDKLAEAADSGLPATPCCASSGCDFGPNGDRALTPDEKMEYARRADERDWLLRVRMWVESVEDIDDGPIVLYVYPDGTSVGLPKRAEVELSPAQRCRRGLLPSWVANPWETIWDTPNPGA